MKNVLNTPPHFRGSAPPPPQGEAGERVRVRIRFQLWLAVLLVLFGMAMISAAFICPPLGIIDASVLTAYGETLTFAGSVIGIDYHYRAKMKIDKEDEEL